MNMYSVLDMYGEDLTKKTYVTNPAISREQEIKRAMVVLLTPEKSALLVGKPGIGKTAIVEGLSYLINLNKVPNALSGYKIVKLNSTALLGKININGREELIIQLLVNELKECEKTILFIDEIHTLMGAKDQSLDFANMFKPALDRGDIKVIGATTSEEYERFILRDKAFVRRFQKIVVNEPTREENIRIVLGTVPKIEKRTGATMMYTDFKKKQMAEFLTDITSEYKRIYEIGSRYPDVTLTLYQQAFSNALFDNRTQVNVNDFRTAILNSKNIYPDVIKKSIPQFDQIFAEEIKELESKSKQLDRLGD